MIAWQDPTPSAAGAAEVVSHVEETFRFLAAPPLWVVFLVVLPATVLVAWWSYTGLQRFERGPRTVLAVLRWLALLLCCFLLFQPAFETTTWHKTQNQVHVLIDDSASMQRKDGYPDQDQHAALQAAAGGEDIAARTRLELVQAVLGKPGGLLEQLGRSHDVRLFRVQRKPVPIRTLAELTARGNRTQLGDALELHLGQSGGVNLDAVILVSDGRNNAGLDPVEAASRYGQRGVPIHTLGVGDPQAPRNAWLTGPPGPKEALREEQVAFDVTVRAEGLQGRSARVELHGSRDNGPLLLLASATTELPADGEAAHVRVYHAFKEAGDWTLRFSLPPLPEESQLDDNQDTRFLRVNDERIRVLYLEDKPRWEYRYVKSALKRVDPSIQVQAMLFEADPTFPQEHGDELPSLRRLPRTEKELSQYHVILIGDVAPERLGATEEEIRSWLQALTRFVEFGGGVGFMWGKKSMPERYRSTPLIDLLPVVLEDPVWMAANPLSFRDTFRPLLENPTQPHDILLLQRDVAFNRKLWEEGLPGLRAWYPVLRAKPGATVLLRHPTSQNMYGKRPLVVTGPHPRGNTFFIATDETWVWRDTYAETYQDPFWRNVVRHLASGRLQRRNALVELTVDKNVLETGDKVRVLIRVHDEELQPTSATEYPVFLRDQAGKTERRQLRPLPGDPGAFQGSFTLADPGAFSFLAFAGGNPADAVLAREDVLVKVPDKELAESGQDAATLRRIAEASSSPDTKAKALFLAQADELAADFRGRKATENREETSTRPAWDTSWSLAALLALLGLEWILRKRARLV